MSFWDVVWFIVISFAFVAYLMVMFSIIVDLFRDRETSGIMKAVWIVCLIFFPLITALVYLIARGSGMAEHQMQRRREHEAQQDAYIRDVAAKPARRPDRQGAQDARQGPHLAAGVRAPDRRRRSSDGE